MAGQPVPDLARAREASDLCDGTVTFSSHLPGIQAPTPHSDGVWVWWVVAGLAAWLVVGLLFAVVLGRGIRLADRHAVGAADSVLATADLESSAAASTAPVASRTRRRAIPLPPIGIALVAIAIGFETVGYLYRLSGSTGPTANLLSMDAPFSLPRMFVATLFAVAALAAVAGSGITPGRRAWWLAVGLVGSVIAAIKAGSTVHSEALASLSDAIGGTSAVAVSAAVALVVVGALWFLSRTERRDRRRILSVLALYAAAAVGLSALSPIVAGAYGSNWGTAATFVEESGEAIAAVAFLMAVLAGVAPRLVLPAAWPLRRTIDAQTLDLPETAPGRSANRRGAR